MHIETLRQFQCEASINDLSSFARNCRDRYLKAARLLEVDSPAVTKVESFNYSEPVNTSLLYPAYGVLCSRYNRAYFSPQENLFFNPRDEQDARWKRYFWHCLVPILIERDDVVLNVLRGIHAIPGADPVAAGKSLKQCVREMHLPEPEWRFVRLFERRQANWPASEISCIA